MDQLFKVSDARCVIDSVHLKWSNLSFMLQESVEIQTLEMAEVPVPGLGASADPLEVRRHTSAAFVQRLYF